MVLRVFTPIVVRASFHKASRAWRQHNAKDTLRLLIPVLTPFECDRLMLFCTRGFFLMILSLPCPKSARVRELAKPDASRRAGGMPNPPRDRMEDTYIYTGGRRGGNHLVTTAHCPKGC